MHEMMHRDVEITYEDQKVINNNYSSVTGLSTDPSVFSKQNCYLRTCSKHHLLSSDDNCMTFHHHIMNIQCIPT